MKITLKLLPMLFLILIGCAKENQEPAPTGLLELRFLHQVDGDSLRFSNNHYTNAAGNEYRVVYLKYFISGVELYAEGKRSFRQGSPPFTINAKYAENLSGLLKEVPVGSYDSIAFSLGVVPEYNVTDGFELSNDDLGMYWPTSMGGGYHFMQFEGHWTDGDDFGGFAFHLGENENLITVGFPLSGSIAEAQTERVDVVVNLNQWFEDPYIYDLTEEGGYTMGDDVQMGMLVSNGHKVFSVKR